MQRKVQSMAPGMHLRRLCFRFAVLSLATATLLGTQPFLGTLQAQEPNPDDRWPCIGMLDIASVPESGTLDAFATTVTLDAQAGERKNDVVRITWPRLNPSQAQCVWGQVAAPGSEFTAMADFVGTTAEGDDRFATEWIHEPVAASGAAGRPAGGEYCFRLAALIRDGNSALRSPIRESCVQVDNPAGPVAPGSGGAPLPPTVGDGPGGSTGFDTGTIAWALIAAGTAAFVAAGWRRLRP